MPVIRLNRVSDFYGSNPVSAFTTPTTGLVALETSILVRRAQITSKKKNNGTGAVATATTEMKA